MGKCEFHLMPNEYLGFALLCITNDDQLINWYKKLIDFHLNENIEWHYMQLEWNRIQFNWNEIWLNWIKI
jgi:hypothetical protein